jgi:ribokinase
MTRQKVLGTGDCLVGAFSVALAENKALADALKFATAAAALSVQRMGASTSMPFRAESDHFLTEYGWTA